MNVVEANGAKIPAIGLGTMTLMEAARFSRGIAWPSIAGSCGS